MEIRSSVLDVLNLSGMCSLGRRLGRRLKCRNHQNTESTESYGTQGPQQDSDNRIVTIDGTRSLTST